ncbi:MAG: hypothetical protein ACO31E_09280 [Phycisphaerales bacterium]
MSLCVPADLVAAPLMRRAFIDSARSLFGLAARMQGKSWFGIARSAEIDARAVMSMRTPPSIGMLARLSGELGFGTATTVGIAADLAESMHHDDRAIAGNPALLHAAIARADIADDPSALSHLASTVWNGAREPGDLALAHLIASRASVARGQLGAAAAFALQAQSLGMADRHREISRQLLEAIRFESMMVPGGPVPRAGVDGTDARCRSLHLAACASGVRTGPGRDAEASVGSPWAEVLAERRHAWALVESLFVVVGSPLAAVCRLERLLDRIEARCGQTPRAFDAAAWCYSIAAQAAMRLLRIHEGCSDAELGRLSRALVRAELALDAMIDSVRADHSSEDLDSDRGVGAGAPPVERASAATQALLVRRRTRVALAEWCLRVSQGEADECTIDEEDHAELIRVALHFPDARELTGIHRDSTKTGFGILQQIRRRVLDGSQHGIAICGRDPSPPPSWAVAATRSEDPC